MLMQYTIKVKCYYIFIIISVSVDNKRNYYSVLFIELYRSKYCKKTPISKAHSTSYFWALNESYLRVWKYFYWFHCKKKQNKFGRAIKQCHIRLKQPPYISQTLDGFLSLRCLEHQYLEYQYSSCRYFGQFSSVPMSLLGPC